MAGNRFRHSTALATAVLVVTLTASCGTADPASTDANRDGPSGVNPRENVTSGVTKDEALASRLPDAVRRSGVLNFAAVTSGTPPFQYFLDNSDHVGLEIDLRSAVARFLGVHPREQLTGFESVLPGLDDGKYDVGQGNFGVTEARKKTIDFVTYYDDGYGFVVRTGSSIKKINSITDLCGLRVATGVGTDFATTLQAYAKKCDQAGKKGSIDVNVDGGWCGMGVRV